MSESEWKQRYKESQLEYLELEEIKDREIKKLEAENESLNEVNNQLAADAMKLERENKSLRAKLDKAKEGFAKIIAHQQLICMDEISFKLSMTVTIAKQALAEIEGKGA